MKPEAIEEEIKRRVRQELACDKRSVSCFLREYALNHPQSFEVVWHILMLWEKEEARRGRSTTKVSSIS
jgi:hypothetical protein